MSATAGFLMATYSRWCKVCKQQQYSCCNDGRSVGVCRCGWSVCVSMYWPHTVTQWPCLSLALINISISTNIDRLIAAWSLGRSSGLWRLSLHDSRLSCLTRAGTPRYTLGTPRPLSSRCLISPYRPYCCCRESSVVRSCCIL